VNKQNDEKFEWKRKTIKKKYNKDFFDFDKCELI